MTTTLFPVAAVSLAACFLAPLSQEDASSFSSTTIDVGIVVSDIEAAAEFYGATLGFDEVSGFEVGADFCRDAGLTDDKPLSVRVFVLGEGDAATKIKLMEVPGVESKRSTNTFIHSQLGLSYLTVYVRDMNRSLGRLAKAGVKPLAKGPVAIGEGEAALQLILVRDPDGNLIELIGPRL